MISKNKTKKQSTSMFGIDDCHNPKKNTKKNYRFKRSIKNKTIKNINKPYTYKNIVLFPHDLGQTKHGTDKAPEYINKFINHKKHNIKLVKNTGNMFKKY